MKRIYIVYVALNENLHGAFLSLNKAKNFLIKQVKKHNKSFNIKEDYYWLKESPPNGVENTYSYQRKMGSNVGYIDEIVISQ